MQWVLTHATRGSDHVRWARVLAELAGCAAALCPASCRCACEYICARLQVRKHGTHPVIMLAVACQAGHRPALKDLLLASRSLCQHAAAQHGNAPAHKTCQRRAEASLIATCFCRAG